MDSWESESRPPAGNISDLATLHIRQEHSIEATRRAVWEILTRRIEDWWSHPYRVLDRGSTMRLELRPNGWLAEHWPGDGFATWGHVSQIDPGITLEMTGPCGMGAAHGVFSFHLQDREGGVLLTMTHSAFGTFQASLQHDFDEAWYLMLTRLKELAEGELAYGADARTI